MSDDSKLVIWEWVLIIIKKYVVFCFLEKIFFDSFGLEYVRSINLVGRFFFRVRVGRF